MGGWTIGCNYFGCFAEQEYNGCVGMKDNRPVGDGTWCYDNKRQTQCTIVIEKGLIYFTNQTLQLILILKTFRFHLRY